jgi:hypothetical protein
MVMVPWDDLHHTEMSQTNGELMDDGFLEMPIIHLVLHVLI